MCASASYLQGPGEIPLAQVRHSQELLRDIDQHRVCELAKSIATNGLLQPILLRPVGSSYEVVFGHHRLEACRRLGWECVQAHVKEMSSDESFLTKVVENIQRNDEINPLIEARGYISLIDHGWTINKIAEKIGKSDSYVSERIGLIRRLHPQIAKRVNGNCNGHLKPSHLELLARIKSKRHQIELSDIVERKRLSVRKLERMITGGQPFKETIEEHDESLYVRLPDDIAEHLNLKHRGCSLHLSAEQEENCNRAGHRAKTVFNIQSAHRASEELRHTCHTLRPSRRQRLTHKRPIWVFNLVDR